MFLANYADVFTDAPLPDLISRFTASNAVVSLLAVPPQSSHHVVDVSDDGLITQVTPVRDLRQWENGGYFVMRPEIFDYLNEGEDLVEDALPRLVLQRRVLALPYKGYWSPADTVKERLKWRKCTTAGTARGWSGTRNARARPPGRPAARDAPGGRAGAGPSRRDFLQMRLAPGSAAVRSRDRGAPGRHRDRGGGPAPGSGRRDLRVKYVV